MYRKFLSWSMSVSLHNEELIRIINDWPPLFIRHFPLILASSLSFNWFLLLPFNVVVEWKVPRYPSFSSFPIHVFLVNLWHQHIMSPPFLFLYTKAMLHKLNSLFLFPPFIIQPMYVFPWHSPPLSYFLQVIAQRCLDGLVFSTPSSYQALQTRFIKTKDSTLSL